MVQWNYASSTVNAAEEPKGDLSPHQGQDVHLPRQAVLDGGHDETGAAEDDLPFRPFVQLRLALSDAENAFQQGPLLLVCIGRTFWRREEPPQTEAEGDVSAEPHPSCGKQSQKIINKCAPRFQKM